MQNILQRLHHNHEHQAKDYRSMYSDVRLLKIYWEHQKLEGIDHAAHPAGFSGKSYQVMETSFFGLS
jgi:hypothetical protein